MRWLVESLLFQPSQDGQTGAWGDHGFAYASEAYINAAFFNESYGVTL